MARWHDPGCGARVIVCSGSLVVAYAKYWLYYVPPDIIALSQRMGLDIAVPLGNRANVREVLEMLQVVEAIVSICCKPVFSIVGRVQWITMLDVLVNAGII